MFTATPLFSLFASGKLGGGGHAVETSYIAAGYTPCSPSGSPLVYGIGRNSPLANDNSRLRFQLVDATD